MIPPGNWRAGPCSPPRRTYQAVFAEGEDPPAIRRALEVLDPALPWEEVADQARKLTEENFPAPEECAADWGSSEAAAAAAHRQGTGSPAPTKRRMFLYAPLYLSSFCVNYCLYCGFRFEEPIREASDCRGSATRGPKFSGLAGSGIFCWSPAIFPSLSAWNTWLR